jgi:hypothetical protein
MANGKRAAPDGRTVAMDARLALGLCLLLAATPLGAAHLTNPAGSATADLLTGDACRYSGSPTQNGGTCPANAGVSGTYVAAGVGVASDAFPLTVDGRGACVPGYCAQTLLFCDLETLSSGSPGDPLKALDEQRVDNAPGGLLVDGTWDDGGVGGACHSDIYDEAGYDTHGCGGTAHAKDAASSYHVWVLAACDDTTPVVDESVVACAVNAVLGSGNLDGCIAGSTCSFTNSCWVTDPFGSCGADGVADQMNLGEGGGTFDEAATGLSLGSSDPDAPEGGVPYPTAATDWSGTWCDPYAVADVFVLTGVEANAGLVPGGDPAGAEHALATAGWIDWSASGGEAEGVEGGLDLHLLPACSDLSDNDRDGHADFPLDGGCSGPLDDSEA